MAGAALRSSLASVPAGGRSANRRLAGSGGFGLILTLLWGSLGVTAAEPRPADAARTGSPEDVLRTFYALLAAQRCSAAGELALGYRVAHCGRSERVAGAEPIRRGESGANRVELSFGLDDQQRNRDPGRMRVTVPLVRRGESRPIDFHHARRSPWVPSSGPAMPPPPQSTEGLLSLWTAAELAGRPGDERITPLRHPDLAPPEAMVPRGGLPPLPVHWSGSLRRVRLPADRRAVALTFDLCERADEIAGYDRAIVNLLRERRVKATFFAGGKWMRTHAEQTLQLMADPLFELGNHAWTHGNLRVLGGQAAEDQILWAQAAYMTLRRRLQDRARARDLEAELQRIPPQPKLFRFPYGTCSPETLRLVNRLGLAAIQWDVVSGDPGGIAPTRELLKAIRPGSIVVFHANGRGRGTAAALGGIVDALRARGYRFETVSELLRQGDPESVDECYERTPGDNRRYDQWFGAGTTRTEWGRSRHDRRAQVGRK